MISFFSIYIVFTLFDAIKNLKTFNRSTPQIIFSLFLNLSPVSSVFLVEEESDSKPKSRSLVMGSGAGNFLKVLLRNFDVLAG